MKILKVKRERSRRPMSIGSATGTSGERSGVRGDRAEVGGEEVWRG